MTRLLGAIVRFMLFCAVYAEGTALANGRFPRAQQIVSTPGDPSRVFLRATFGVVASFDGGTTWRWLCEDAIGFSGTWDPPVAATRDGRLWMGLEHGLSWTIDACNVHAIPSVAGELVSDVSADGDGLLFATSTHGKPAAIWRATGDTARHTGATLDGFYIDTLDAAGARIYATGVPAGAKVAPHIFRSDDYGATLHELHPTWPTQGRLYLAAIDPKNASRVLVRQLSANGSDLLLSEDAGATFAVVLHMKGAMFGFAQSDDGHEVWAGSGDADEGLWRSTDRGRTFAPVAKAPVFCLHATPQKLFTCSNPFTENGYALGISTDEGATLKPLIGFADVAGPVACDGGAGVSCGKSWSAMHATLTTQTAAPAPSAAPSADAAAPAPSPRSFGSERSTCGCGISAGSVWPGAPLLALLGALVARRRRSRANAKTGSEADQHDAPPDPGRAR
ncbi:MAG TPA: hypothetical protein VGH28_30820 [Polyangiaceae bacterium]